MKQTRQLMGMPITVEICDSFATEDIFDKVFSYFDYVDKKFSTYKDESDISQINRGEIKEKDYSQDMLEVWRLCEETKKITNGYFDIKSKDGKYDPSGLVKGWAINNAAKLLQEQGFKNFYVEAGGDIEMHGQNSQGKNWRVGIRNPFNAEEIIKVISLTDVGVATSGTYIRGQHIYNPHQTKELITEIVSLSVIGPNIYEADRFATTAFAMGKKGIDFIERLAGFEGYMIDKDGIATMTSGFDKYVVK
ncbi:MAG: ApbE family lipoprotein [Parcubacteria group bacterium Gr01-1014_13]|nr:MAG: ApbE family lipoprotein [Parcubacteria group bacterium Gr01-1014_13]